MANFIVVIDNNSHRKDVFLNIAKQKISPLPGLLIGEQTGSGWFVLWAASKSAPISTYTSSGENDFSIVWGTPIDGDKGLLTATEIHSRQNQEGIGQYDGFYCTISIVGNGQISASADILGLFPVYYWNGSGIMLVSSSIELIRAHPEFQTRIDTQGLVGILLTNGLIGGHTLFSGVRRLAARHELRAVEKGFSEQELIRIDGCRESMDLPFEGHVEQMSNSFRRACQRHYQLSNEFGMFLSGGIDSRMLAGGLAELGKHAKAVTFGRAPDTEARFAASVASKLSMSHEVLDVPSQRFPEAAAGFATWDCLSSGFSAIPDWVMAQEAAKLPPYTILGHTLDGVIGGLHVDWAYDRQHNNLGADTFLNALSSWGFSVQQLQYLLRESSAEAIGSVVIEYRNSYESTSSWPHLQAWHADLATRQRFHVGIALWITSFRTWPIVPALDTDLLAVSATLPGSSLFNRRTQIASLIHLYPHLAALRIDRNSANTTSLTPRLRDRIIDQSKWQMDHLRKQLRIPSRKALPLFYDRLYNLNSSGWKSIRIHAGQQGYTLPSDINFSRALAFIPDTNSAANFKDPIRDAGRVKLLIGLSLLSKNIGIK